MMLVPHEIASQHARMAEIAMLAGHEEKAIQAIRRAFEVAKKEAEGIQLTDSISRILTVKISNILIGNGISTIGQLVEFSAEELVNFTQIRWRSLELIRHGLMIHGFRLRK